VNDPLALVAKAEICDAKVLDIILEGRTLEPRVFLLDEGFNVLQVFPGGGGNILLPWLALASVV